MEDKAILDSVHEATLLGVFRDFCEKNSDFKNRKRLRNIYNNSSNYLNATHGFILTEMKEELDSRQCERMNELIQAFLNKSPCRIKIDSYTKKKLLSEQQYRCAICGCVINGNAPVDHIIPFKYVGDELHDNYQMLCKHCNSVKNDSIDYQIRMMLMSK